MTINNNDDRSLNHEETLGSRIAKRRRALNLTQEELSQLLGVTAQAVSKWENDASCPDIMLLPKISQVLDVSIDELMGVKTGQQDTEPEKEEKAEAENVTEFYSGRSEYRSKADIGKLKLRIHIVDNKNKPVRIALPMPFVMRMANMGVKISGVLGTSAISDSQLEQILELVRNGVAGEIFDFTSDDGTKIKIEIS